jgi:hypothetical protein
VQLEQLLKIQAIHGSAPVEARYVLRTLASNPNQDLSALGDEALAVAEKLCKSLVSVTENFELAEDLDELIGRIERARLEG